MRSRSMSDEAPRRSDELLAPGAWCWHTRLRAPCRIVERQDLWGAAVYRVWLPSKDSVLRASASDLAEFSSIHATAEQVVHAAAATRLLDALEDDLLLAPIQSSVVPLPHQIYALNRALSRKRIRYLLADEVGLGKTIEAGLVLRELKLRGLVERTLVVAPKGLVRQWQAELQLRFNEAFQFVEPAHLAAFRPWRGEEENLWLRHDQVICSLDSVKPVERRRGWGEEQLADYNRERFEDLVSAQWDLVIIDEAHRMGGSTDQVARYKLGAALAEAAPYLLLLSATPHQGKTDQFMRLMQLLDRDAFLDESSVNKGRVGPYVIRTEKRAAIDAEANPLFKPRATRLYPVTWQAQHAAQRRLYDAVTDYARNGYNQALASQQRHIGFLMLLLQRLVTSSTAAIRTTLEKRLEVLSAPHDTSQLAFDEWDELDGQEQADLAVQTSGLAEEQAEVGALLKLARETEAAGQDAKAEALVELIYKLQQEEHDPALKVLVFTEFVPTQAMLAKFLENRGFAVERLNGSMDMGARVDAQRGFAGAARVLVSTDAGGEGLNLQFCHVVINFDIPWNPMRLEQRIGRVDRIGQAHAVQAFNLVLDATIEHRVREVLESKLAVIADEFGVDKTSDVMDSVASEQMFDAVFARSLQDPGSIAQACDDVADRVREQVTEAARHSAVFSDPHELVAGDARRWRDHPAQFWLEQAVTAGLSARGGCAVRHGAEWHIQWPDGTKIAAACFDGRTAEHRPDLDWITLEDPRARAIVNDLPMFAPGMAVPVVEVAGLPDAVRGVWSLWEMAWFAGHGSGKRYQPVFVTNSGRGFAPTARRIWDLLATAQVTLRNSSERLDAEMYEASRLAAQAQTEPTYRTQVSQHHARLREERERELDRFDAGMRAIGRIGLPAVRTYRCKRLEEKRDATLARLSEDELVVPQLRPILMLRVGEAAMP